MSKEKSKGIAIEDLEKVTGGGKDRGNGGGTLYCYNSTSILTEDCSMCSLVSTCTNQNKIIPGCMPNMHK